MAPARVLAGLIATLACGSGKILAAAPGEMLEGVEEPAGGMPCPWTRSVLITIKRPHVNVCAGPWDDRGPLRFFSGACQGCLKECLGAKVQRAQANSMKYQAPISLITWYLFNNRPFKMWPLEDAMAQLGKVHPADHMHICHILACVELGIVAVPGQLRAQIPSASAWPALSL